MGTAQNQSYSLYIVLIAIVIFIIAYFIVRSRLTRARNADESDGYIPIPEMQGHTRRADPEKQKYTRRILSQSRSELERYERDNLLVVNSIIEIDNISEYILSNPEEIHRYKYAIPHIMDARDIVFIRNLINENMAKIDIELSKERCDFLRAYTLADSNKIQLNRYKEKIKEINFNYKRYVMKKRSFINKENGNVYASNIDEI